MTTFTQSMKPGLPVNDLSGRTHAGRDWVSWFMVKLNELKSKNMLSGPMFSVKILA